jgi:hypothetical protein
MKTLLIILLIVAVMGLYFYTDFTKEAISITGDFVIDKIKNIVN